METYSEVITNKTTIDKSTHIFAPKHPKDLHSYRMVYDTISVETMNSILFDDSVIIRSGKSGSTTYNNNTGVANYNDDSKKYHYKTYRKMNQVRKIWILPSQVHSNILIIMVVSLTMISVCSIQIICQRINLSTIPQWTSYI